MIKEEYIKRFKKLHNLFTEIYLSFYIWKGLQDKSFEQTFSENLNFWFATLSALENNWLTGFAKIYEDSKFSKKGQVISVYALLPFQVDIVRAKNIKKILNFNDRIIKSIRKLRDNQLGHNNTEHLLKPKELLRKFPIKYDDVERLLLLSGEILSNFNPDIGWRYDYENWAKDCENDAKQVIKKLQYYSKLQKNHLDKVIRGEISDYHFPPVYDES